MKYDTEKISNELKNIKAPYWVQTRIQGLTGQKPDEQKVSLSLSIIVSELTEAISDAENSPLDASGREQVEVIRRSSKYLKSLLPK